MAISASDLIQLTDRQTYLGQECLNVYFYRAPSGYSGDGTEYLPLLESFRDDILPAIAEIQAPGLEHYELVIRNLSNGLDEIALPVAVPGSYIETGTSTFLPPFMANSFQLNRVSLATRNGRKRYAGVTEGMISNGISILSSVLTDAVNVVLVQSILDGDDVPFVPIIVKRPIPAPGGVYVYSQVGSATYKGVSTQNSRKIGHGD